MSNDDELLRLWRLQTKANMLVSDGKREAKPLLDFLQEYISPAPKWRRKDGIIYLSLESDGTTGSQWIPRLESMGFGISSYAKEVLSSADFKPTRGRKFEVAILPGELFGTFDRLTNNIRSKAKGLRFVAQNAETACLLREKFSNEEIAKMGISRIVSMHKPIKDLSGVENLLVVDSDNDPFDLSADERAPGLPWLIEAGFMFEVPHKVATRPFIG